jgi:hypothetical protein
MVYKIDICFLSILFANYLTIVLNRVDVLDDNLTVALFFVSFLYPVFLNLLTHIRQDKLMNELLFPQRMKNLYDIEKSMVLFADALENFNDI